MYCVSIEFGRTRNAVDSTITRWKSRGNLSTVLNQSARVFALGKRQTSFSLALGYSINSIRESSMRLSLLFYCMPPGT